MTDRRTFESDGTPWVVSYLPKGGAGEDDAVEIHTLTTDGDFGYPILEEERVSVFLSRTEGLVASGQVQMAFKSPKDCVSVETLRLIRAWIKSDKRRQTTHAT